MTTISNNYFEEYTSFIEELQKEILRIQLKYDECQALVRSELSKGMIAKEVAEKMLSVKINQFAPSIDRMYRLSKREVDFINEYAALDANGNVLATMLKEEYLEKAELLEYIKKSVLTAQYYENMDPVTKRNHLKSVLINGVMQNINNLKAKASILLKKHGEKIKDSKSYQQILAETEKYNRLIDSFEQIIDYDDQKVVDLIESLYKIDYKYYTWYMNMKLKSLKESGELYTAHSKTMATINNFAQDVIDNHTKTKDLSNSLFILNNKLLSFLESISSFDLSQLLQKQPTKHSIFKKSKPEDNKEVLKSIFYNLVALPGAAAYIQDTYGDTNKPLDLTDCFEKMFISQYGEEQTYVDINIFIRDFQKLVVSYYKTVIEKAQKSLNSQMNISGGTKVALANGVEKGYKEALLHEQAFNASSINLSSILKGFTMEEQQKIFSSLTAILEQEYNYNPQNPDLIQKRKH